METINKICARLVEFEESAAALYLGLARRFKDNSKLSWFWLEMSMEEGRHALLLNFCAGEQMISEGLPDIEAIQKISDLLRSIKKRAGWKELSVDDAFLLAAELEGSEINDMYAGVIRPVEGTSYIMKEKVQSLISDHMQTLLRGARTFGVSPVTLAKLTEMAGGNGAEME